MAAAMFRARSMAGSLSAVYTAASLAAVNAWAGSLEKALSIACAAAGAAPVACARIVCQYVQPSASATLRALASAARSAFDAALSVLR